MSQSMFMRARRPEQKQQRRAAILAAARELALESGVRNVSLSSVATAVGLAKSNVTRYFGTREEIYLELAAGCWRDWADEVVRRLVAGDDVVDVLAETLAERTLFCDLLGHAATSLEHNVSVPAARDFKRAVLGVVAELGAAVAQARPDLTEGEGFELVAAASGLAGMLYPAANPPPTLLEVYAQNPDLAAACVPFAPTLKRALAALAAGLPTLR
ncbi:TetR family transcriptional regulator [Amycolatopsis sp. DG1A-15b]|uniref:TetR family transcriptional regulator n=1 Tax=Amycolatopsis sp. DG1A-15b TaxID=3052846 RepID=UPI00255C0961|nr:TetR family transcriptional regulator [Amycolatopsis sp. DG1A-15b]WIX92131.1 TetR family transcriptional regulator [Amycolatopsis sp. DG1A-15b]